MLVICQAREIRARISRQIYLWEKGVHAILVGDEEGKGAARDGRDTRGDKEEEVMS